MFSDYYDYNYYYYNYHHHYYHYYFLFLFTCLTFPGLHYVLIVAAGFYEPNALHITKPTLSKALNKNTNLQQ